MVAMVHRIVNNSYSNLLLITLQECQFSSSYPTAKVTQAVGQQSGLEHVHQHDKDEPERGHVQEVPITSHPHRRHRLLVLLLHHIDFPGGKTWRVERQDNVLGTYFHVSSR